MIINIEFTRPKKLQHQVLSRLIRLVEGTKYSHVRLHWINSVGADIVYEAGGTSVKFKGKLAQIAKPVEIIDSYQVEINKDRYKKLVKLCMENAGIEYGFLQLVGILLVRIFNLKYNPLSRGRSSQVCSEIVGVFLQDILGIGKELNLDIAGPKDIQKVLKSSLPFSQEK
jgi:hypothetical protein